MKIINNNEIPIGFGMELAKNSTAMSTFASMPEQMRQGIIEGSRNIQSKQEMEQYVNSITATVDRTF